MPKGSGDGNFGENDLLKSFFEETFEYTSEIEGQYPRPWMTDLADPLSANCFIVGRNQRNGYNVELVGEHSRHVEALFNINEKSCRGLYDSLFAASPTRRNIDRLSERLKFGGAKVLETNVVCFSTPMSSDLSPNQRQVGTEVFKWLCERVSPRLIVVHGRGAAKDLAKIDTGKSTVIEMAALAPPAYNKWHSTSERDLDQIAERVLSVLN